MTDQDSGRSFDLISGCTTAAQTIFLA